MPLRCAVCGAWEGFNLDVDNDDYEMLECKGCGVAAHRMCYGLNQGASAPAAAAAWRCDLCLHGIDSPQ